jgi:hypothetical protein
LVIKIPKLIVTCRRPTTLQDRTRDSDEEDRDYDVAALANNLSQAFRYKIYGNDDNEEDHNALDRDDDVSLAKILLSAFLKNQGNYQHLLSHYDTYGGCTLIRVCY